MTKKNLNFWMPIVLFLGTIAIGIAVGRSGSIAGFFITFVLGFLATWLWFTKNQLKERLDESRYGKLARSIYLCGEGQTLNFDCHHVRAVCSLHSEGRDLKLRVQFDRTINCLVQITAMDRHAYSHDEKFVRAQKSFLFTSLDEQGEHVLIIDLPEFGNGTDQILVSFRQRGSFLNELFAVIVPEPQLPTGRSWEHWSRLHDVAAVA